MKSLKSRTASQLFLVITIFSDSEKWTIGSADFKAEKSNYLKKNENKW